jgi:hypothetical protein
MAVKIRDEFIDELVKGCKTADDIVGSQGVAVRKDLGIEPDATE